MSKSTPIGGRIRRLEASRKKLATIASELAQIKQDLFTNAAAMKAAPFTVEHKRAETAKLQRDALKAARELAAAGNADLADARRSAKYLTRDAWVRDSKFVELYVPEKGFDVGSTNTPTFIDGKASVKREEKALELNWITADEMVRSRFRSDLRELSPDEIRGVVADANTPIAALSLAKQILPTRSDIANDERARLRVAVDKAIESAELPKEYEKGQRLAAEVADLGELASATVAEIEAGEDRAESKSRRLRQIREKNPDASMDDVIGQFMDELDAARAKQAEAAEVAGAKIVAETMRSVSEVAGAPT